MAEQDDRRGRDSGKPGRDSGKPGRDSGKPGRDSGKPGRDSGKPGQGGKAAKGGPAGKGGAPKKGRRQPGQRSGGGTRGAPPPRPAPHTLKLDVGGHGMELRCDTCDLVVTHLAAPQVRRAVEEAHRAHRGELTFDAGFVATCRCGWNSGKLSQQAARDALAAHEQSFLRAAARGEASPS